MSMENLTDKEAKKLIDFHKKHGDTPQLSKEEQTEGVRHTPGPWIAHNSYQVGWEVYGDGKERICVMKTSGNYRAYEEHKANAELIARAPELASSLSRVEGELERVRKENIDLKESLEFEMRVNDEAERQIQILQGAPLTPDEEKDKADFINWVENTPQGKAYTAWFHSEEMEAKEVLDKLKLCSTSERDSLRAENANLLRIIGLAALYLRGNSTVSLHDIDQEIAALSQSTTPLNKEEK